MLVEIIEVEGQKRKFFARDARLVTNWGSWMGIYVYMFEKENIDGRLGIKEKGV